MSYPVESPIIQTISDQSIIGIFEDVPLADKNWFQTGGSARYYAEPSSGEQLGQVLNYAKDHNLSIFVLGQGANILISDDGFDGLVIRPYMKHITHKADAKSNVLVTAGAGVTINDLIEYCLSHNISGLEEFSGIPGTVGGSVYINLHYFEFLLSHFIVHAEVLEKATGKIYSVDNHWFNFGYNQSTLHQEDHYLITATFALKQITDLQTAYAQGRRTEIIRHRVKRYPATHTCGSFFRNFHDNEVALMSNGKKMIFVAYYLDKIGVKGNLRVGDAIVSYQHANMIVNCGSATSADIIQLVRTMQELVKKEFSIIPQPECRLIGFTEYPLL